MRLNLAEVKKILSENSHCPQCKEEAKLLDIQKEVSSGKDTYLFSCNNGHEWEVVEHSISKIMSAYLTHTAKVPETKQEAKDHFGNCDWCQKQVAVDEWVAKTSFAQQTANEALKRSRDP